MNTSVTNTRAPNPIAEMSRFMDRLKPQMALALPKHLTADRMARLALTAFSSTPKLQLCNPNSIAASIMTAATLGLEPGVNGQGFLVPYGTTCTFVPGWKGLVDIANRSGRVSVWTGAVFEGDTFDYSLGDTPFVRHQPGDEDDPTKITHVYAVGRVNGSNWPVIEVWTIKKIWKHRNQYNKVGQKHYSYRDPEMYARKVPLLQVLKYMPTSIELSNALAVSNAAEEGRGAVIDGNFVTINEPDPAEQQAGADQDADDGVPICTPESFAKNTAAWKATVANGRKSVNDLIATIETRERLTTDQKVEIASWAVPATQGEAE
ncbi:recombinase RecT [Rhodoferax koreense]|uniref:Recombinase RecT n=1 Tax=Rhodoferax koreensis TaxID=1842727 RepID=A0A1P8JXJ6_9BURK|nr:recombinase RecT [Rhodoferax koreense]APW38482.1 recombinase RecT [Rhodoferax koreense]